MLILEDVVCEVCKPVIVDKMCATNNLLKCKSGVSCEACWSGIDVTSSLIRMLSSGLLCEKCTSKVNDTRIKMIEVRINENKV